MVQSSTAPTVVVIAGGSDMENIFGVCPSTVMKNSVGPFVPLVASAK
jgi:hypothetical protein